MPRKGGVKENLKPFKKGYDERRAGNGRKPKLPDIDILMANVLGEEKDGLTAGEAILKKLRQTATAGSGSNNIRAAEVLLNRGYGMPKQRNEHTGKDGKDLITGITVTIRNG